MKITFRDSEGNLVPDIAPGIYTIEVTEAKVEPHPVPGRGTVLVIDAQILYAEER